MYHHGKARRQLRPTMPPNLTGFALEVDAR